ncbi:uncharacterized protein LOC131259080 [Anopheles coustani]|uniref:uncharacterized protein LOC131259080 n=1 Tax=Anopheles coustani TaxID=139045 RepID=UPI00265B2847|nr:uncharacterized protein LOC131259080 [Anopheles coustani]
MFLVAETKCARGEKELDVVPRTWVRTTKTGRSILLWPSKTKVEVIKEMSRDATSQPQAHWNRSECKILRTCETFSDAESALEQMFGQSSSEDDIPNKKNTAILSKRQNFDTMFVTLSPIPPPVPKQKSQYPVPSTVVPILPPTNETVGPTTSDLFQLLTEVKKEMQNHNNKLAQIKQQQQHQFNLLQQRQDSIEKSLAEVIVQQRLILEEKEDPIPFEPSFMFKPMDSDYQLQELEARLNDEAYKQQIEEWLKWSVTGKTSGKRMLCCFDLLFSRKLQERCTWTGLSRDGTVKIALMNQHNVIHLFKTIATTNSERVNSKMVAAFLMQRLKNIRKRPAERSASEAMHTSSEMLVDAVYIKEESF